MGKGLRIPAGPASLVLATIYGGWCSTLRYDAAGLETIRAVQRDKGQFVAALWHDELFPLSHLRKEFSLVTVVSQSSDGEILARTLERLGLATARGSSSRGGVKALLAARRLMKRERLDGAVVTVDGPRGPRHQAKDGAAWLANMSGASIIPVRAFMDRVKTFNSWDRFQLPLPGCRVRIVTGEPYTVEGELTPERLQAEREKLEQAMAGIEP